MFPIPTLSGGVKYSPAQSQYRERKILMDEAIKKAKIGFKIINRGKLIANAYVELGENDWIRITGYKILKGNYDETGYYDNDGVPLFVKPPSYTDEQGRFHDIVFTHKPLWDSIQHRILEEYHKTRAQRD